MKRPLVAIVACCELGYVGGDNKILWDCKEDMQFFRRMTIGNVVIMGRKTFESMGSKPLPNRMNIVLTTNPERITLKSPYLKVVSTLDKALMIAQEYDVTQYASKRNTADEVVYIIGGEQIYLQTVTRIDQAIISFIDNFYCTEHCDDPVGQQYTNLLRDMSHKEAVPLKVIKHHKDKADDIIYNKSYFPEPIESKNALALSRALRFTELPFIRMKTDK